MNHLKAGFISEVLKLKHSWVFRITVVFFVFIPVVTGLMMYLARHPEIASKLGMVGMKANMFGENDWNGFLMMQNQIVALIGIIGFGFVTAWVFGREYMEHTMKDLLALPVSRTSIVLAKFMLVVLWCVLLTVVMLVTGLLTGMVAGIPGWSPDLFFGHLPVFFIAAILTILLVTPIGFISSCSRGIVAPIAFVILVLIMAQIFTVVGWGPYFPWSVPGVYTVPSGTGGLQMVTASYIILIATSLAGLLGTIAWWRRADQH